MKITRITPILADGGHRIIVFVKVETDQPGLIAGQPLRPCLCPSPMPWTARES